MTRIPLYLALVPPEMILGAENDFLAKTQKNRNGGTQDSYTWNQESKVYQNTVESILAVKN